MRYCISPLSLPLPQGPCCEPVLGCEELYGGDIWLKHLLLWVQDRLLQHSETTVGHSLQDANCPHVCVVHDVLRALCSAAKQGKSRKTCLLLVMVFLCPGCSGFGENMCQGGKRGQRVAAAVEGVDEISSVWIPPSEEQTEETTLTFSMFHRAG